MKGQLVPILLNCAAAVFGAFGQYLYKKGGVKLGASEPGAALWIAGGIAMFCLVMAMFVFGYRYGGKISVVYPFYATTFIWGTLLGIWLEREPWHPAYFVGVLLVLAGTAVIAWNSGSAT